MSIDIHSIDGETLLRSLKEASKNSDIGDRLGRPIMEAQRMELRSRFDSLAIKHDLKVGDLVRFKPGLSVIKAADNKAMIIWRMFVPGTLLDDTILEDLAKSICFYHEPDCIVAFLSDDGSSLHLAPALMSYLEPDPEAT